MPTHFLGDLFTPAEDKIVLQMRSEGKSFKTIGEAISRSRNSIIGRWHRNLKKREEE